MTSSRHSLTAEQVRRFLRTVGPVPAQLYARLERRDLQGTLLPRPASPPPGTTAMPAAVAVLIYPSAGGLSLALTRRTSHLPTHAGQISFPGGRIEADDPSALEAALRETREELGVAEPLALWAELSTVYIPPSNFQVQPFVLFAPGRPVFHPNTDEVDQVLEVGLDHLLDPASLETEVRDVADGRYVVPYFRFETHKIWGATAMILGDLIGRIETGLSQMDGVQE